MGFPAGGGKGFGFLNKGGALPEKESHFLLTQKENYFKAFLWKLTPAFHCLIDCNPMEQIISNAWTYIEHKLISWECSQLVSCSKLHFDGCYNFYG